MGLGARVCKVRRAGEGVVDSQTWLVDGSAVHRGRETLTPNGERCVETEVPSSRSDSGMVRTPGWEGTHGSGPHLRRDGQFHVPRRSRPDPRFPNNTLSDTEG